MCKKLGGSHTTKAVVLQSVIAVLTLALSDRCMNGLSVGDKSFQKNVEKMS